MPRRPSNRAGLERTLRAMVRDGRLGPETDAVVALARGLALAVDTEPGSAPLWREYRQALAALAVVGADRGADDDTAEFLVSIRTPPVRPAVGDPPDS